MPPPPCSSSSSVESMSFTLEDIHFQVGPHVVLANFDILQTINFEPLQPSTDFYQKFTIGSGFLNCWSASCLCERNNNTKIRTNASDSPHKAFIQITNNQKTQQIITQPQNTLYFILLSFPVTKSPRKAFSTFHNF